MLAVVVVSGIRIACVESNSVADHAKTYTVRIPRVKRALVLEYKSAGIQLLQSDDLQLYEEILADRRTVDDPLTSIAFL